MKVNINNIFLTIVYIVHSRLEIILPSFTIELAGLSLGLKNICQYQIRPANIASDHADFFLHHEWRSNHES